MSKQAEKKQEITSYIIDNLHDHPGDIVKLTASFFGISRQTVLNHISRLTEESVIESTGVKKGKRYRLKAQSKLFEVKVSKSLSEHDVWDREVLPFLPELKENVRFICSYGFMEMLNNVIDHSESSRAVVHIEYDAKRIRLYIRDYGVGIFNKIQKAMKLGYKEDAILELHKGKYTTDPDNHSGEGIFFTSRLFDGFDIVSDGLYFEGHEDDDWLMPDKYSEGQGGTWVSMEINRESPLDPNEVFDKFTGSADEDFGFQRTQIALNLLDHGGTALVSRSQARRLVMRFEHFKEIYLDFSGIRRIGQAFADEVFRVFQNKHPNIAIKVIGANESVMRMINHVKAGGTIQSNLFDNK